MFLLTAGRPRTGRATAALMLIVAAVGLGGHLLEAGAKKAPTTPKGAFDAALDAQKPAIVDCVMEYAIKKGASSVRLDIKVLVNRSGQVFGLDLQVTQQGGDQKAIEACVKKAIQLSQFPPSRSALTELRRQWTFATK